MENQESITVTIEDVAFGGNGVARHNKQVVFVPQTLTGEKVDIALVEDKKKFLRGKVTQIVEKSPFRQEPPCPYFGPCQGCVYQHSTYEHQLALKKKQVEDLLRRIGKIESLPEVKVVGSNTPFGFRNKIKMHLRKKENEWVVGFIGEDNNSIIDIETCAIAHPAINARLKILRAEVAKEKENFEGVWIARTNSQGKEKDFFFDKGEEKLESLPLIKEEIRGKSFLSPFDSFFQTNHEMLESLVREVEAALNLSKEKIFVDAYSGVGLFTLLFASKAKQAIGIEQDQRAIGCARKNQEILHVKNSRFILGTVEEQLKIALEKNRAEAITLLLDPPRKGCHPNVLQAIAQHRNIQEIIYVSCNPATLARDLKELVGEGYRLKSVALVDMFPQTAHIEIVCALYKH